MHVISTQAVSHRIVRRQKTIAVSWWIEDRTHIYPGIVPGGVWLGYSDWPEHTGIEFNLMQCLSMLPDESISYSTSSRIGTCGMLQLDRRHLSIDGPRYSISEHSAHRACHDSNFSRTATKQGPKREKRYRKKTEDRRM